MSLNDRVNKSKKIKDFKNFQVNSKLMNLAKKDAIFLHCLPRGDRSYRRCFFRKAVKSLATSS